MKFVFLLLPVISFFNFNPLYGDDIKTVKCKLDGKSYERNACYAEDYYKSERKLKENFFKDDKNARYSSELKTKLFKEWINKSSLMCNYYAYKYYGPSPRNPEQFYNCKKKLTEELLKDHTYKMCVENC